MMDSSTTVIASTVGGLLGLLLLIIVFTVILGVCIRLCICRKKQKYNATGMSYNIVSVLWSIGRCSKIPAVFKSACIDAKWYQYVQCMHAIIICVTFFVSSCTISLQTMTLSKWSVCRRTQLMKMCMSQRKTTTVRTWRVWFNAKPIAFGYLLHSYI